MSRRLKESIVLIVAILIVIATIAINFISIIKYEILEYKYEDIQNEYRIELEQRDYELEVLEEHNLRLENMIKEQSLEQEWGYNDTGIKYMVKWTY